MPGFPRQASYGRGDRRHDDHGLILKVKSHGVPDSLHPLLHAGEETAPFAFAQIGQPRRRCLTSVSSWVTMAPAELLIMEDMDECADRPAESRSSKTPTDSPTAWLSTAPEDPLRHQHLTRLGLGAQPGCDSDAADRRIVETAFIADAAECGEALAMPTPKPRSWPSRSSLRSAFLHDHAWQVPSRLLVGQARRGESGR